MARRKNDENLLDDDFSAAFFTDEEDDFVEDDVVLEETIVEETAVADTDDDNSVVQDDNDDNWLEEGIAGQLALDVYENDTQLVVKAPIAGVDRDSIDVSIADNTLTIHGTRKKTQEVERGNYFVQECYWGEFSRSVILPVQIKEDEVDAQLKDGVLTITFHKLKANTVKKIQIN